jgi:uncharacterized membrane protein YhfC
MLTPTLIVQIVVLFVTPVAVGFWIKRRWGVSWGLFFGGALAFVASWIIVSLLPLGNVINMVLSSIVQMGALYLIYRYQYKTVRTEREAIMAGVGLGGIELILLGVISLFTLMQMLPLRNATDATLTSLAARIEGIAEADVEPSQLDELRELSDDYWTRPWYTPLLQLSQPLTVLPIQAALAVIVLWSVTQNDLRPLFGAMALHYLSRILPAYGAAVGGLVVWAVLSLLFCAIAVWFLAKLRPTIQRQNQVALDQRRQMEQQAERAK